MLLYPYKIKRSSQIVVPIVSPGPGVYSQISFPDQPYLRNRKIVGMTAVGQVQLDGAAGNIFLTYNHLDTNPVFVTLVNNKNEQFIQNLPLAELYAVKQYQNTSAEGVTPVNMNGILLFQGTDVIWPKSYLLFPNGINISFGAAGTALTAIFNVYYE
jgi:hypothetical protein